MRLKVYKIKIYLLKIVGTTSHESVDLYYPFIPTSKQKIAVTISVHISQLIKLYDYNMNFEKLTFLILIILSRK